MRIKPEDLKNYVGKKIRYESWSKEKTGFVEISAVGKKYFLGIDSEEKNYEFHYPIQDGWETYEEPKKKVKLEQWMYSIKNFKGESTYHISDYLIKSGTQNDEFTNPIKCMNTYEVEE